MGSPFRAFIPSECNINWKGRIPFRVFFNPGKTLKGGCAEDTLVLHDIKLIETHSKRHVFFWSFSLRQRKGQLFKLNDK